MADTLFSRYSGSPVVEIAGVRSLGQRPDRLPLEIEGATHIVIGGETLDQIALKFYGHEELWWRVADANPTRVLFGLKPGDQLVIPPLKLATATPRTA